jgi:hypothetical protein
MVMLTVTFDVTSRAIDDIFAVGIGSHALHTRIGISPSAGIIGIIIRQSGGDADNDRIGTIITDGTAALRGYRHLDDRGGVFLGLCSFYFLCPGNSAQVPK